MKTISRYIMTLALLITAVGGAWATDVYVVGNGTGNWLNNAVWDPGVAGNKMTEQNGVYSITFTNVAANSELVFKFAINGTWDVNYGCSSNDENELNKTLSNIEALGYNIAFGLTESADVTISFNLSELTYMISTKGMKVGDDAAPEPAIEVTTNAAEEGATFTEASFQMPTFDATAEYELVRDMGYKVAFSGVPNRARLAKDGDGKFHFADGLTFQLLDNIDAANPKDITSAEGITFMVGEMEAFDIEGSTYYRLNKETLVPLADFLADAHLGTYVICAVASTGEYDGSFSSDMITLFQGYEVAVPAGEYATFYKADDENLYVEDTEAKLYTITDVSSTGTEAIATELSVAPANTPLLVKNNSSADKIILLIPTNDAADNVTAYSGFVGTTTATNVPASDATTNNYALNGKQFVWVKTAVSIAANRAWLQLPAVNAAPAVTIAFGAATGIGVIDKGQLTNDNWYDLNGRRLQGRPTRKGVYILNGKKVVVKN